MGSYLSKAEKKTSPKKPSGSTSQQYFKMELSQEHRARIRILIIIIILILGVVAAILSVRSTWPSFCDWGGVWAYLCGLSIYYPPLAYLIFTNHYTPTFVIATYYFCLGPGACVGNIGCCAPGMPPPDKYVFDSSLGNPKTCAQGQTCNTAMQICEANDITDWNTFVQYFGAAWPNLQEGITEANPSLLSEGVSVIKQFGIPAAMIGAMIIMSPAGA